MGFYYPHSLCPVELQISESRCPNQVCKTQTRFLTEYRLDGHNLEIEGESSCAGNLRKVKFINMAEGMLKWDFLWVETTWKIFFRNVKDHSGFLDPSLNRKKHTKLTREDWQNINFYLNTVGNWGDLETFYEVPG